MVLFVSDWTRAAGAAAQPSIYSAAANVASWEAVSELFEDEICCKA